MPSLPTNLADITQAWVAGALGVDRGDINSFHLERSPSRRGYGSEIGYISLDSANPAIPERLIVKVPPRDQAARDAVRALGSFARETAFYQSVAPLTPIRTPALYAVELDRELGDGILLFEDCSGMTSFEFDGPPPTLQQMTQVTGTLARLHGRWWGKTRDLDPSVVRPGTDTWSAWAISIQSGWRDWLASPLTQYVPADAAILCERLSREFYGLQTEMWPVKNLTLTHMDLHVQNIFLDPDNEDDPVVIFDWDGCHLGCGAHDLAYLLSLLPTDYRRRHEMFLLDEYLRQLRIAGVTVYDRDDLIADYRFGCLFSTYLLPVLLELVTDDAGMKLAGDLARRILQSVFDHEAQKLLGREA